MYNARILADSLSPSGVRLTTFEVTFPRFILAEFNTHRTLSRNSASSRAIPTELLIEQVQTNPFIPEFNKRVKGMGVGERLGSREQAEMANDWQIARDDAVRAAQRFLKIDKSRANRVLEPYMWHTALVTATDYGNFFALRTHPSAQPEFRIIASLMQGAYDTGTPWDCAAGCWHLPLCTLEELGDPIDYHYWKMVSTGRCARVSYLTHDGLRDPAQDVGLHNNLLDDHHLSPFEHVARPFTNAEWEAIRENQHELRMFYGTPLPQLVETWCRALEYSGNFRGFVQYRAEVPNEHDFSLFGTPGLPA